MSGPSWINIEAAFEFLLEELEAEQAHLEHIGTHCLKTHADGRARTFADLAAVLTAFRREVRTLRTRWQERADWIAKLEREQGVVADWRNKYRLHRAPRTPVGAYADPILSAIHAVGGAARTADLVRAIPHLMQGLLRPADQESLTSVMDTPRWRNALTWARRDMLDDGWLEPGAPHDVWQATEAGLWRRECAALRAGSPNAEMAGAPRS